MPPPPDQPPRTRVVLSEIQREGERADHPQAAVADVLIRGLVRAQLALALRLAAVVLAGLGSLPLLFSLAPSFGGVEIAGFRLPWVLLGVLAYPFLIGVGITFVRFADRNEHDFTALHRRDKK